MIPRANLLFRVMKRRGGPSHGARIQIPATIISCRSLSFGSFACDTGTKMANLDHRVAEKVVEITWGKGLCELIVSSRWPYHSYLSCHWGPGKLVTRVGQDSALPPTPASPFSRAVPSAPAFPPTSQRQYPLLRESKGRKKERKPIS